MKFFKHKDLGFIPPSIGTVLRSRQGTGTPTIHSLNRCKYLKDTGGKVGVGGVCYLECSIRGRCYSHGLLINGTNCFFSREGESFWKEIPDIK